jgi:signal transduction histidine kinase
VTIQFWLGLLFGVAAVVPTAVLLARIGYRRVVNLQQRLRQSERLAELGTLTGGLAHEIKNPLSTVQLNLQLLHEDLQASPATPPRVHKRLTTVRQETSRLRDILESFLRYAGNLTLERHLCDPDQLVDELIDFLSPQALLQKVELRHTTLPRATPVSLDAKLIRQALLNLMLNAIQAMPDGGTLTVEVRTTDAQLRIGVIDTGPGIPADEQARIFQAYYSKKRGGTGLGLAMTRRIAEEHGGGVLLESQVGAGSRFTIVLPLLTTPAPGA